MKWISDYLNMRKINVSVIKTTSDIHNVNSSVPKGGVLAPLFFLLHLNDIFNVVKYSKIVMYADDLTFHRV